MTIVRRGVRRTAVDEPAPPRWRHANDDRFLVSSPPPGSRHLIAARLAMVKPLDADWPFVHGAACETLVA